MRPYLVASVVARMEMDTFLGIALFHLGYISGKVLSFPLSLRLIGSLAQVHAVAWLVTRTFWGWALGFGPWALRPDDVARTRPDCALGTHPADPCSTWVMESQCDAVVVADYMPHNPNVSSDGCCVTDELACISVAGAVAFSTESGLAWHSRSWGHLDDVTLDNGLEGEGCRLFCRIPGPLQSVQRAYYSSPSGLHTCFCWVDNQNVVSHLGDLLSGTWKRCPLPQYISDILRFRGASTVQVCKVKGHATDDMVTRGRVRRADLEGKNRADEAADLGRRRQTEEGVTAWRICLQACHAWYPPKMHLHRCLIAVAGVAVNHDPGSGTAPDPTVWSVGAPTKKSQAGGSRLRFCCCAWP